MSNDFKCKHCGMIKHQGLGHYCKGSSAPTSYAPPLVYQEEPTSIIEDVVDTMIMCEVVDSVCDFFGGD